jgi:predicted negative regulator of RcsB-dependent stress response
VEDLSEKEQLDMMRTWWSENGRYVVGGVILGVAILFSWNQWKDGIADAQLEASTMYEEVMTGVGDENAEAAAAAAAELFESHPGTAYASQSRLAMARLYMDKGRDQDAVNVLQGLVDEAGGSEVGLVGRLRLARVLLYQDKAEDVIALLEDHRDNAFASRFNEVLGDAYVALGSYAEAEVAYTEAMTDPVGSRTVDTNLIQLKINDLPMLSEVEAATPGVAELPDLDSDAADNESPEIDSEPASDGEQESAADEQGENGGEETPQ